MNEYKYNTNVPFQPGAYLINSAHTTWPIYKSLVVNDLIDQNNLNDTTKNININDTDDCFIVMPGYKLIIYVHYYDNSSSANQTATLDNTTGTTTMAVQTTETSIGAINSITSVKLYYKGVEVTD
jgi:hypothetical protein